MEVTEGTVDQVKAWRDALAAHKAAQRKGRHRRPERHQWLGVRPAPDRAPVTPGPGRDNETVTTEGDPA